MAEHLHRKARSLASKIALAFAVLALLGSFSFAYADSPGSYGYGNYGSDIYSGNTQQQQQTPPPTQQQSQPAASVSYQSGTVDISQYLSPLYAPLSTAGTTTQVATVTQPQPAGQNGYAQPSTPAPANSPSEPSSPSSVPPIATTPDYSGSSATNPNLSNTSPVPAEQNQNASTTSGPVPPPQHTSLFSMAEIIIGSIVLLILILLGIFFIRF